MGDGQVFGADGLGVGKPLSEVRGGPRLKIRNNGRPEFHD